MILFFHFYLFAVWENDVKLYQQTPQKQGKAKTMGILWHKEKTLYWCSG